MQILLSIRIVPFPFKHNAFAAILKGLATRRFDSYPASQFTGEGCDVGFYEIQLSTLENREGHYYFINGNTINWLRPDKEELP
jgi:hypothetical protein